MPEIKRSAWEEFASLMSKCSDKAAEEMRAWLSVNGWGNMEAAIEYMYGLIEKYGEAAASLACEMYDATAALNGANVPPAEPAAPPPVEKVRAAVNAATEEAPATVPSIAGRYVKQRGADTTLQNAQRDGAKWAWVPNGDTCAFCLALASRGWQRQSKEAAKAHAEHIHNHCNCNYAVSFDGSGVEGYDPTIYERMYYETPNGEKREGKPNEKIKAIRKEIYATNDRLREQKHEYYEAHKEELKEKREKKLAEK